MTKYDLFQECKICLTFENQLMRGFPGGAVVKNPPANAGDTGSSPGPRRSHMSCRATKPVHNNY